MNWVGGARARARAQKQPHPQRDARYGTTFMEGPTLGNMSSGGPLPGPSTGGGLTGNTANQTHDYGREPLGFWATRTDRNADNTSQGHGFVNPRPPRRVVPLLEFAERNLPMGDMLRLHLDFVVDITRTPAPIIRESPSPSPPASPSNSVLVSDSNTDTDVSMYTADGGSMKMSPSPNRISPSSDGSGRNPFDQKLFSIQQNPFYEFSLDH